MIEVGRSTAALLLVTAAYYLALNSLHARRA